MKEKIIAGPKESVPEAVRQLLEEGYTQINISQNEQGLWNVRGI